MAQPSTPCTFVGCSCVNFSRGAGLTKWKCRDCDHSRQVHKPSSSTKSTNIDNQSKSSDPLVNPQAECNRLFNFAKQYYDANNKIKAKQFARRALHAKETQEVKDFLKLLTVNNDASAAKAMKNNNIPAQINILTMLEGQKKRIILKNSSQKNQYDYNLIKLKEKVMQKYKDKGLSGWMFDLKTNDGRLINNDNDIINILSDYKEPLDVIKKGKKNSKDIGRKYKSQRNSNSMVIVGDNDDDDDAFNEFNKKDKLKDNRSSSFDRSYVEPTPFNDNLFNQLLETQTQLKSDKEKLKKDVIKLKKQLKEEKKKSLDVPQQDMVKYQQQIDQLLKENQVLKQQVIELTKSVSQPNKFQPKGDYYECDQVLVYKSKQINDIVIRSDVTATQKTTIGRLNQHVKRLAKWGNYSQNLLKEFLKHNKPLLNNKKNINNVDDKKNNDNDNNTDEGTGAAAAAGAGDDQKEGTKTLDTSTLLFSYTNCMQLLRDQHTRSEEVATHFIALNNETKQLRELIQPYIVDVPTSENKYKKFKMNYERINKQRINNQSKAKQLVLAINTYIEEENKLNNNKCNEFDKFNLLTIEQNKYRAILKQSQELTKKYAIFEQQVDDKTDELEEYFNKEWDNIERKWLKWNINDIICWFKYLIYRNKLRINDSNLNDVEKKMKQQKISGKSLHKMIKSDIAAIGFNTFDDKEEVYTQIRCLVEKYPPPSVNPIGSGAVGPGPVRAQIQIPKEYICELTNAIMCDPVIVYDGNTYEKKAILKHLQKHKKTPHTDQQWEGDEPMITNRVIKRKIKLFLKMHPQFTPN